MSASGQRPGERIGPRWAAAGEPYAERGVVHDAAYQDARLRAADVDPALYGDGAEAGLFGLDCFASMNAAGLDIDGYVFMSQTYRQIAPLAIGAPMRISGHVRRLQAVRRGVVAQELYTFRDDRGRVMLESELSGLLADAPGAAPARADAPPLPPRAPQPADGWTMVAEKQITPDKVRTFSQDVGNEIHFDEAFARRHGFRAPLAQGIMSAVWLLSALAAERPPTGFHVTVRYLRPVFWDALQTLWVRPGEDGSIGMVQSRCGAGKATADLTVDHVSYAAHDGGLSR